MYLNMFFSHVCSHINLDLALRSVHYFLECICATAAVLKHHYSDLKRGRTNMVVRVDIDDFHIGELLKLAHRLLRHKGILVSMFIYYLVWPISAKIFLFCQHNPFQDI